MLTALIGGPAFGPLFRGELIRVPAPVPGLPVGVPGAWLRAARKGSLDMRHVHREQWA